MPGVTPLPPAPSLSDPANFASVADTFVAALGVMVTEINALGTPGLGGGTMLAALGFIAGSVSAPGLFVAGDTNTGIYSPAADQIAIACGGSVKALFNSSGVQFHAASLGIGSVAGGGYAQFYKDASPTWVGAIGTVVPGGSAQSKLKFSYYDGSWHDMGDWSASGIAAAAGTFSGAVTGTDITASNSVNVTGTTKTFSFVNSGWSGGVTAYTQAGVNPHGTGAGDYWFWNVPTGKNFSWSVNNNSLLELVTNGGLRSDFTSTGFNTGQTATLTKFAVAEGFIGILSLNVGIFANTGEMGMWAITCISTDKKATAIINNAGYTVAFNGSNQITVTNNTGGNRTMYLTLNKFNGV